MKTINRNTGPFRHLVFAQIVAVMCQLSAPAATTEVPFRSSEWNLSLAPGAKVVEHNGRESLYIEQGLAFLKGIELADGVIEVDMTTSSNPRVFARVAFRVQSPEEYEEAYLRLHKSGSPDAIQYAPVFNGVAAWQLHGPGDGWAMASFDKNSWVPFRLEFEGRVVRIFAGKTERPVLVTRLRREQRSGSFGVAALFGAYFSNFRYTRWPARSVDVADPETPPGTIRQWELSSRAFEVSVDRSRLERAPRGEESWKSVSSEPSGLVNISRYHKSPNLLPESGRQVLVGAYARVGIESKQAQVKKLLFGYSDDVAIFLNGKPVFTGRSGFRSRDPLFQGVIGYHDAVFLDLKQGANELIFAVADAFGGWGLMARFADMRGIEMRTGGRR